MLKCVNCEAIFYRRDVGDLRRHFKNSHTSIWDAIKKYEEYELMVLYSDKKKVKFHNINKLNSLLGLRILEFKSEDWSMALSSVSQDNEDLLSHEQMMKYLERKNLANEILCLKVCTKVISIYNDKKNEKIVNGTFGKVVGFRSKIDDQIYGREGIEILNFLKEQNLDPVIKFENLNKEITVK
ncbi:31876_t:CDS:1 [Gigaspora margarita]|uniref:31876_t:CDS:1 n=1 Tax=Gigaspora margarita TaxID=4874 RepID=A0ABN7W3V8_GIGMA|nr:31876_t:CDS:1 [Gigaspora margarita]